jgi:hypothetical protein
MTSEEPVKSAKTSKEEFDIISNRLAVALAKRESLIKSWTASSSRPHPPRKTQEDLDAEDAALFRNEPAYLGVGAPIPSHFLVSEAERNNKSLRAKFFPTKGLKASKARDAEEKAASAKRGLKEESSDEEEGRSGLGRAKKLKTKASASEPVKNAVADIEPEEGILTAFAKSSTESQDGVTHRERDWKPESDKTILETDRIAETDPDTTRMNSKERKKMRKKEKKKMQKLKAMALASKG